MSEDPIDSLSVALFSEMFMADQLAKSRLTKRCRKAWSLAIFRS